MIAKHFLAVALIAATAAGCAQTTNGDVGPREGAGTLMGAVGGGLIGSTLGSGGGSVAGAAAGALIGGLLGNRIGAALDEDARQQARAAEYRALEYGQPGAPVTWRHERYYGSVTPGPYVERSGYERCRTYAQTVYIDGRPETMRGTACRQPDGSWRQAS